MIFPCPSGRKFFDADDLERDRGELLEIFQKMRRSVGRSVVDGEDLVIFVVLLEKAVEAIRDVFFLVFGGHDDGNFGWRLV